MSKFLQYLIFGIVLIGLSIFTIHNIEFKIGHSYLTKIAFSMTIFLIPTVMIYLMLLSWKLTDIVAFKYKIVYNGKQYDAKYLTLVFVLIPYWKAVNETYHSYEVQNLFGAKFDRSYSTDIVYDKEHEAIQAITRHKERVKENRSEFFNKPETEITTTKYY